MKRIVSYALFPLVFFGSMAFALLQLERGEWGASWMALVTIVTVIVVAAAERFHPFDLDWNRDRGDTKTDAIHLVVSNLVLPEVYKRALFFLFVPAGAWIAAKIGFDVWPHHWPLAAQGVLAMVVAELSQYWVHRTAHERDFAWRLHATHHSPSRLYWLNAGRDHPLGLLMLFSSEMLPLLLLGINEQALALQILSTVILGLFQHANIDVRLGPLNRIFSSAEIHRWHHSTVTEEAFSNYGSNLSIWDSVFGTFFLPPGRRVEKLGLENMPSFPTNYLGQLSVPFRWRSLRS